MQPDFFLFSPRLSSLESRRTTRFDSSWVPGEDPPSCPCGGELGEHSLNFWVRAQASDLPTFQPKARECLATPAFRCPQPSHFHLWPGDQDGLSKIISFVNWNNQEIQEGFSLKCFQGKNRSRIYLIYLIICSRSVRSKGIFHLHSLLPICSPIPSSSPSKPSKLQGVRRSRVQPPAPGKMLRDQGVIFNQLLQANIKCCGVQTTAGRSPKKGPVCSLLTLDVPCGG